MKNLINTTSDYLKDEVRIHTWKNINIEINDLRQVGIVTRKKEYFYDNNTVKKVIDFPYRILFTRDWNKNMLLVVNGKIISEDYYKVTENSPHTLDVTELMNDLLNKYENLL